MTIRLRVEARLGAAALVLAACASERIASLGAPVVVPADAWSGNTLVLESAAFGGGDSLPIVTVGINTLPSRTLGHDSVEIVLPDTSGVVTLRVRLPSGGSGSVNVHVHGFVSGATGPVVEGVQFPWSPSGAPTALAIVNSRLDLFNVASGTTQQLSSDTNVATPCFRGPAPSATEPNVVTIGPFDAALSGCGPMIALTLPPGSAAPDTGPTWGWSGLRLGPGAWLAHGYFYRKVAPDSFVITGGISCASSVGFVISPRRDRVVPTHCLSQTAVPIVDPAALAVAYTVPPLIRTGGAAFTPAGDTLFLAGSDSTTRMLFAIEPTSGRILLQTKVIAGNQAVAVDSARPWLYVAGQYNGQQYVEVFDRGTLARVATLRAPIAALPDVYFWSTDSGTLCFVLDAPQRRLYLVLDETDSGTAPMYVMTFDLMP